MLFEAQLSKHSQQAFIDITINTKKDSGERSSERKTLRERLNEAVRDREIKRRKEYIECVNMVKEQ